MSTFILIIPQLALNKAPKGLWKEMLGLLLVETHNINSKKNKQ